MLHRPVLPLYDNDTRKTAKDLPGNLYVRALPDNLGNIVVKSGIENLLPASAITQDMYEVNESTKPNGDVTTVKRLRKRDLCSLVCRTASPVTFEKFGLALDLIEEVGSAIVQAGAVSSTSPTDSSSTEN
jgi:hypothetical protein